MSTTTSSLLSSVKMSCYFDTLMDHIEGPSQIRTSVSIFLITLAASEVLIYVVCKAIAWYAHVTFYQGDYNWIHETSSDTTTNTPEKIHEPSLKDIQRALCSFVYGSSDMVSNERISDDRCCPICLGEFGMCSTFLILVGKCVMHHVMFSSAFIISRRTWRCYFFGHHLSPLFSSGVHHRMVIETNVVSLLSTVHHEECSRFDPRIISSRSNRRTWTFLAISISRPGNGSCLLFIRFLTRVVMMRCTDEYKTPTTACCTYVSFTSCNNVK
jgi:hypothetical protein